MSGRETVEENENQDKKKTNTSEMFIYLRELLFLFALLITSYATLYNNLPKLGKPPPPVPFFPPSSIVHDYYRGTLDGAFERANQADMALVMFYAPWDADSQAARPVLDAVARFLKDEVYVCAVSCWAPNTECKQNYPKIRSFPVLVAFPQQAAPVQYKGPMVAGSIVRFVKALVRPVHRVHTVNDVAKLFYTYEAVVLGSFDFEGNLGGRGYFVFYSTALKMLMHDFGHEIAFAVTTNAKDAAALGMEQIPSLRLHLWNSTIDYPLDDDYTEDAVSSWLLKNVRRPVKWLHPSTAKTMALSSYVSRGPTLLVFTPGTPLHPINPLYSQIREISLRYYNCDNDPWLINLSDGLEVVNRGLQSKNQRLEVSCSRMSQAKREKNRQISLMSAAVNAARAVNNRTQCGDSGSHVLGPQLEVCMRPIHSNFSAKIRYDTSMWHPESDEFGSDSLLHAQQTEECRMFEASHINYKTFYPATSERVKEMTGVGCATNKTLSFVVMDSLANYQVAEGLGVNVLDLPDKTAAVIIDANSETDHVLEQPVNQASLVEFIQNFTEGVAVRHMRSSEDWEERSVTRHTYPVIPDVSCTHSTTQSCVPELHSRSFLPAVMDQSKAVIVMYHSPLCTICRSISHILLLLARYFRHFTGLRFYRIDGERNDLPWRYTMESYPTILFFPAQKKEESRVFSDQLPFTVQTLMHFVLANLEPEAKVPAMLSLCKSFQQHQTLEEAHSCKAKVQAQIQEGLSYRLTRMRSLLARWALVKPESDAARDLHKQKTKLMHSLQYFRTAGFVLGAVETAKDVNINELYTRYLRR